MVKRRVTFTVEDDILDEFRKHCRDHAFNMSARVELLIKEDMARRKGDKSLLDFLKAGKKAEQVQEDRRVSREEPPQSPIQIIKRMVKESKNPKRIPSSYTPTIDKLRRIRGI